MKENSLHTLLSVTSATPATPATVLHYDEFITSPVATETVGGFLAPSLRGTIAEYCICSNSHDA